MRISEEVKGEVAVIMLKGPFLYDDDDSALQQKVASLQSDGIKKLVIDLGKVNRINSRGLSALISATKSMRNAGGDVRLAQIDKDLGNIFMETRLVKVFDTYETVDRALASY